MADHPISNYPDLGVLGEDLIAQWLLRQDWTILHRRWRCRWGEIDIIALQKLETQNPASTPLAFHSSPVLAFVEVKTRTARNWDAGGLLAITPQKQTKLCRSANYFLATYPHLADYQCRFDVALVNCQRIPSQQQGTLTGYQVMLQEYLPAAFDIS